MPADIEPIGGAPVRLTIPVCRTQTAEAVELRGVAPDGTAPSSGMPIMSGHFSTFGDFYPIDSAWEGRFLEKVAPGAFKKTLSDNASRKNPAQGIKVLLEHGHDPQVADKPIGIPLRIEEDSNGPAYDVQLLDTSYVRDLVPALEAGAYGSSFRFQVVLDDWDDAPTRSDANPDGLPERTIREARVMEFGPTMFPANGAATAGLRSTTDDYYAALRSRRPEQYADALRSVRELRSATTAPVADPDDPDADDPAAESGNPWAGVTCADTGYQKDGKKRYPIDTAAHAQLSWAFINHPDAPDLYSPADMAKVKAAIKAACAKFNVSTDVEGQPVAGGDRMADPAKPFGDVDYADPGYQDDGKKRYPLDTKAHAQAAWSYINQAKNAGMYSAENLAKVKSKIKAACTKFGIEISDDQSNSTPPAGAATSTTSTPPAGAASEGTEEPHDVHSAGEGNPANQQRGTNVSDFAMTVEERQARQEEIRARITELDTEYAGGSLPAEQQAEMERLASEHEDHDQAIRSANARKALIAKLAGAGSTENGTGFTAPTGGAGTGGQRRAQENIYDLAALRRDARSMDDYRDSLRENALRAVERGTYAPAANVGDAQSAVERLLKRVDDKEGTLARRILVTGSPIYSRAFGKVALSGGTNTLTNEERASLAAGAGATGDYAVPFDLDPTVILTNASVVNPIRQIARVVQTVRTTWEGVTSAGVTVSRAAEAAEASDNSPTLAQPSVTPSRVQAFIPFSFEIEQDWTQIQEELGLMLQEGKNVEEATAFVTGNNTPPNPQGVLVGATNTINTGTTLTLVLADLFLPVNALPPRHEPNAAWLAQKAFYNLVRSIDIYGGAALWTQLGGGRPSELAGYPVYEASTMPNATGLVTTTKLAIFGDFQKFLIVDRIGMSVELIPHLFGTANNFPTGQRGLFAIWRNGSAVLDSNAFRVLVAK
jgi:HK97 family phage major capsid protein/HK97 family phage prohead protease